MNHPTRREIVAWSAAGALSLMTGPLRARAADTSLADQARATLDRATAFFRSISTQGGYLWSYSADLSDRRGETKATASQIWVQPPGNPCVCRESVRTPRPGSPRECAPRWR